MLTYKELIIALKKLPKEKLNDPVTIYNYDEKEYMTAAGFISPVDKDSDLLPEDEFMIVLDSEIA